MMHVLFTLDVLPNDSTRSKRIPSCTTCKLFDMVTTLSLIYLLWFLFSLHLIRFIVCNRLPSGTVGRESRDKWSPSSSQEVSKARLQSAVQSGQPRSRSMGKKYPKPEGGSPSGGRTDAARKITASISAVHDPESFEPGWIPQIEGAALDSKRHAFVSQPRSDTAKGSNFYVIQSAQAEAAQWCLGEEANIGIREVSIYNNQQSCSRNSLPGSNSTKDRLQ
jgi:hypothetical protein